MTDDLAYFEKISVNARKWADILQTYLERPEEERWALALKYIENKAITIIRNEIKFAIEGHKEFNKRRWMLTELVHVFNTIAIIRVDPETGKIDLQRGAEGIAGDWEDFWTGYEAARNELAPKVGLAPDKIRWKIWREKIWPDTYMYNKTMALRRKYWGDKKPWWLWLEVGNEGLQGAWPQNKSTGFLWHAQCEIQYLFDGIVEQIKTSESNIVEQMNARYLDDPTLEPYDILAEFFAEGKEMVVYVTPKLGLIGVTEARRLR